MKLLGCSIYNTMSPANNDSFIPSFPTCMLFFPPYSCLTVVARSFNTMLNKIGDSGHPCLVSDLRGNGFNFSLFSMNASSKLVIYHLYYIELCSHHTNFVNFFFINRCWISSSAYPASIAMHCLNKWMRSADVIVRPPSWLLGRPLKESRSSVNQLTNR